jgi:hypothetical protein
MIHPSTPRSPQWSLSLRFTHQDPIQPSLLTHTRHMSESTTANGKHVLLDRYGNAANKYEDPLSFYFNLEHVK